MQSNITKAANQSRQQNRPGQHLRIGYACKCVGVPGTQVSSCIAAKATAERLTELIGSNLNSLDHMMDYNIMNGIRLFRISSDIIPFGSSPLNQLPWEKLFERQLKALGDKAVSHGMRLSMHPGQYTVLNSPDADVVMRAREDLDYHCLFLDSLGLAQEHKIILHIGGVYGDKQTAVERFCANYSELTDSVKHRLVIENDERNYSIEDVYRIGIRLGIPVVFDNLHHSLNRPETDRTESEWVRLCGETWRDEDGRQKMHYAQQDMGKRPGAHALTIDVGVFRDFIKILPDAGIDIMLEVKDKNRSALKCINCCTGRFEIRHLEEEWARYKYDILAHSHQIYTQIRALLKDKSSYPAWEFYTLIDRALGMPADRGWQTNAADHVWGYFKDKANLREKNLYLKKITDFREGRADEAAVRSVLYRMAVKYQDTYLLSSYYFI